MKKIGCFKTGSIVNSLKSKDRFDAIKELIRKAPILSKSRNRSKIEEAAIDREKIYSTGIGHGVAIAHGKTSEVKELNIVLGISKTGINFNSLDGLPVHLLFLISCPPDKETEYLIILSSLARVLRNKAIRDFILTTDNPDYIKQKLSAALRKYAS